VAAYVIAYLEVTDPQAFQVYREVALPTLAAHGGRPVVVDGALEVLEGMIQPRAVVVVEFESMEQARRWYTSPEYAKAVSMRQQAANSSLILVEGVSHPRTS
jgi:uncharacterized protein (DUF1330 family)